MMHHTRSIPVLIAAWLATAGSQRALADRVTYLTTSLEIRTGEIVGMSESALIVQHGENAPVRIPTDRIASVDAEGARFGTLPAMPDWAEANRVFIDLIDGQRMVFDIGPSDDPGVLTGTAQGFGPARIPLERVLRIARPGAPVVTEPTLTDRVVLTNGDELTGFVASIGAEVGIENDNGTVTTIGLDRIESLRLANPPELEPGVFVSDSSGKLLRARTFEVQADRSVRVTADAAALGVESNGEDEVVYLLRGVLFTGATIAHEGVGVVPLASIEPDGHEPTGDRSWTQAPVARAGVTPPASIGDVFLPAPASVRYPVPRGAARFACEIEHRGGDWTDCTAAAFAERRDGSRVALGTVAVSAIKHPAGTTAGAIIGDLPGDTVAVVLEVNPGRYGAVQDAVVFRDARLLVAD